MPQHQHKQKRINVYHHLFVVGVFAASVAVYFGVPSLTGPSYDASLSYGDAATSTDRGPAMPLIAHVETPEAVKAIYMTSCVAGTPSFREQLVDLIVNTELNAVVIDIKDYSGGISFAVKDPQLQPAVGQNCYAQDLEEFVEYLHENDIYTIARITVFQDPFYAPQHPDIAVKRASDGGLWKDYKGLSYIDPGAKKAWDYITTLSKETYDLGFDELNFDYIRFPSDGDMKDIAFPISGNRPKDIVLEEFFAYLHEQLTDPAVSEGHTHSPVLSADIFGMTTTNTDHLNIGQVLERALPYFDYIAPMVYPSHYPRGFNGWSNPNHYPYEIVRFSMQSAVERTVATTTTVNAFTHERIGTSTPTVYAKPAYDRNKLRPWLQDFDYGGDYDIAEVRGQIQATYDAGLNSWMLWDPANRYTRGALKDAGFATP